MCWKKYKVYRAILFYPIFAVQPIMAQTDSLFLTVEQLFEKGVQHNLQLQADIMKESMARERAKTARAAQFPMQQAYIIEYQRLFILKGTSCTLTIERSRKENVRCLHSIAFAHGLVPPFSSLFVKYPLPCTKH